MSNSLVNKIKTRPIVLFGMVFMVYFALWAYANWPALKNAWWFMDDYPLSKYLDIHDLLQ
jgi:hypothetical protein